MNERKCPEDPNHKRFITVAHISQDWLVDEHGDFIKVTDATGEVVHGPNHGNIWTCAECGCDETEER